MQPMAPITCPACAAPLPAHGPRYCISLGRALSLIGGLVSIAAYFMPWLGISMQGQGITLTGEFLGRFLGNASPAELARFVPGLRGDPSELLALRVLVLSFPAAGVLAALLALLGSLRPALRHWTDILLTFLGALLLVAVVLGIGLLPTAATPQVGLGLIGLGALAILLGLALDTALRRRARRIGIGSQVPGAGDVAPSSIRHPDSRLPTPDPHP